MAKTAATDRQTKLKVFRAASDVFEEKGYDGARMQEIADKAGINKALLHYYFGSKDQLFMSVFQVLLKKMFERIMTIVTADITFREKIRQFIDHHIDFLNKNPKLPIFLLNEVARNPSVAAELKETFPYEEILDLIYEKHAKELKGYGIKKSDLPQLLITIVSMSVFPYAARHMIAFMMPRMRENRRFKAFMDERKEFATDFILNSLKQRKK